MNGVQKENRVVIVDDVISTGGTMKALIGALNVAGAEIVDICVAFQRGTPEIGRPYKALVSVDVSPSRVRVLDTYF